MCGKSACTDSVRGEKWRIRRKIHMKNNTKAENVATVEREREREREHSLFNMEFVYSTIDTFTKEREYKRR